jgi:crotonobetainyl-CoA:carnitine CoA-transferase CaiB-like acyl-CoA transferase
MSKWGLGYDQVKMENPRVVYATFYAYGPTGPLAHFGANDLGLQAHCGLMSITGDADRPPVRCGTAAIDLHASLGLVSAITMALFHRERTGFGQEVYASLLLSSAHLMNYFYTDYWATGNLHGRMGTANHLSVPNQAFPASDGMVIIIAPNDDMWLRCVQALDADNLRKPEFLHASDRLKLRVELVAELSAVTSRFTCEDLMERLSNVKVNVAKVQNIGEAADHEQLAAVGGVVTYERQGKLVKTVASPFMMSSTPASVRRPAPELGEHTKEVLADFGISPDEIETFGKAGAFGSGAEK